MYAIENDGQLPSAANWQDEFIPYFGSQRALECPSRPKVKPGFAYNLLLNQRSMNELVHKSQTPAFFESSLGVRNGADMLQSFTRPHDSGQAKVGRILFLDGHVKARINPPSASAGLAPDKQVDEPSSGGKR
jgi:hypothetical protein